MCTFRSFCLDCSLSAEQKLNHSSGNFSRPPPWLQLQLHKGLFMPCVAFHAVRSTPSLVSAMSSVHFCCLGDTHTRYRPDYIPPGSDL